MCSDWFSVKEVPPVSETFSVLKEYAETGAGVPSYAYSNGALSGDCAGRERCRAEESPHEHCLTEMLRALAHSFTSILKSCQFALNDLQMSPTTCNYFDITSHTLLLAPPLYRTRSTTQLPA